MTVNTTSVKSGPYPGNDFADEFSYGFRIENKTQLIVYETDDASVVTTLILDTDYTVAGVGVDGGGTVTRTAGPLPTNYQWLIVADYKETQLTAFNSQGGFFPDVHEDALDKLTFLSQQNGEELSRALVVPVTDTTDPDDLYNGLLTVLETGVGGSGLVLNFDHFTADGFQSVFILSIAPPNAASLLVTIDGIEQNDDDYSVVGKTLTFFSIPSPGVEIVTRNLGTQAQVVSPFNEVRYLSNYSTWADAVSMAGVQPVTLVVDIAYPITFDIVIPATVSLQWNQGCVVTGVGTFTIDGDLIAGDYQLFGSDTVIVFGTMGRIVATWFGATPEETPANNTAAFTAAVDSIEAIGSTLSIPRVGTYSMEGRFPIVQIGSGLGTLRDYNGITVEGTGKYTILQTESPTNGADVFNLNYVKNVNVRNVGISSILPGGATAGSNAVSVTGAGQNILVENVHAYVMPYIDNGANLDGGKAFTIQVDNFDLPVEDITFRDNTTDGGAYGFDVSVVGASLVTGTFVPKGISCHGNIFRNFYRGIVAAGSDNGSGFDVEVPGMDIRVEGNSIIDCQQDFVIGRITGVNVNGNTVLSSLTGASVYTTFDDVLYGARLSGLKQSVFNNNIIYKADSSYYVQIEGASGSADSRWSSGVSVIGNVLYGVSDSFGIKAASVGGNIAKECTISGNTISGDTALGEIDPLLRDPALGNMVISQNHYEQGTWVPILADGNLVDEGATYSFRHGSYTKIGNRVFYTCYLGMSGLGTLTTTTTAAILGLPYPNSASGGEIGSISVGEGTSLALVSGDVPTGKIGNNTDYIMLSVWDNSVGTGVIPMTCGMISATGVLILSGSYVVA